ncbi:hypothetical protein F4775DRAFT_444708 [Biscogniauxia sp. FL1348]|nr:hypothetical protein F4775DRAFT_444708 [Biscogniauxia sp. FL1348]
MNILEMGSLTRWTEIRKKNHLIDSHVHMNRQVVELARDEIERRGNEFIDDIQHGAEMLGDLVRKVSKKSLRSKHSHDSSENENPRIELRDMSPPGPPGAGLAHEHAPYPRDVYVERECVMGQTVKEEPEEISSMDGGSDDDYRRNRVHEYASHMTESKVRPYLGFQQEKLGGDKPSTGDYVIDMEKSRREHAHHEGAKVRPADPDGSEFREQHGAHMHASKVKAVDMSFDNMERDHGSHMHENKVKPADLKFEDVDLVDKDHKKSSRQPSKGHMKED